MFLLGIDPALGATGYIGVEFDKRKRVLSLLENGVIKTPSSERLSKRVVKIYNTVEILLKRLKPEAVVLEKVYSHWRHPTTAALLGHVRGVIILCVSQKNIPMFEYSTTHIKKAVTGRGNASNMQMKKMVEFFLGEEIKSEHIVYATSLILAHINTMNIRGLKNINVRG